VKLRILKGIFIIKEIKNQKEIKKNYNFLKKNQKIKIINRQGQIDSLSNLQNQKVYIFAGKSDNTVDPKTSDKTQEFYLNFMNQSNILYESSMDTGHAHITDNYGNGCKTSSSPYINNCGYDQSGALLAHLHRNALKPKVSMVAANLQKFDQTEYPAESMQKEGFVYVPTGCQNGDLCGLHVALHGCVQNSDNFQGIFYYY